MTTFTEATAPTYEEWCDHKATLSEKEAVLFISHETPDFDNGDYLLTCYVADAVIDGVILSAEDFEGGEISEDPLEVMAAVEKAFESDIPEVYAHNSTGDESFHINGAEFTFEVDEDEVIIEFTGM